MGILRSLSERIIVRLMDRSQYSSVRLRAYFSRHYDIRVGMYSYGCFDRWRIPPGCRIGRYCSFAKTARVFDAVHPMSALSTSPYFYHPGFGVVTESRLKFTHQVFEDDVWVGHNACITHSCSRIGRGAVIGAGAVVTRDVPPYAIVVGMPAKVVAYRFDPQTIERIERSGWWNLNLEELRKLMKDDPELFFTPGINGDQTVEIA